MDLLRITTFMQKGDDGSSRTTETDDRSSFEEQGLKTAVEPPAGRFLDFSESSPRDRLAIDTSYHPSHTNDEKTAVEPKDPFADDEYRKGDLERRVPQQEEKDEARMTNDDLPPYSVLEKSKDENGKDVWLIGFDGEDDPDSPLNLPTMRKWIILVILCSSAVCVTCASSMVVFTYPQMEKRFNISREVATLGVTTFIAGLGIGPLFLGPLSEFFGRSPIYNFSFLLSTLFTIPVALAPNIIVFLVFRFLTGFTSAAFLSVAGGTVADMFHRHKVGAPMTLYTSTPFFGAVVGPVVSGFVNQHTYFRWTWYTSLIWYGVNLTFLVLVVPETYAPAILKRKARRIRKVTGEAKYLSPIECDKRSKLNVVLTSCRVPFALLAVEPMAFLLNLWTSIILGILYMFFGAFPIVFGEGHGFEPQYVGVAFVGIGLGIAIGSLSDPPFRREYERTMERLGRKPGPEEHLKKAMVGGVIFAGALFWFAFTTYPSVHWIVPILSEIPLGIGMTLIYQAVFTFLVDCYRPYAASAMAGNSFMRSSFAAGFPLFSVQMYKRLGTVGATALCAGLCTAMIPLAFLFYKIGPKLRRKSKY
ncbi:MFS general substrate transporter, partial [Atractiella rhizophila]